MAEELDALVRGRPVYVHIDCDVLNRGIVPTDYTISNGMSLEQVASCARALARGEIVGLEVGELEVETEDPESDLPARTIVGSLESVLAVLH
ncbi:arginase family protein [Rhodococcus sp. 077-4]|uniref:arginase family protein n=1 Tax=Rhodococcus sp. 077-4 TaxID=2789271 RepID=UPI0039F54C27